MIDKYKRKSCKAHKATTHNPNSNMQHSSKQTHVPSWTQNKVKPKQTIECKMIETRKSKPKSFTNWYKHKPSKTTTNITTQMQATAITRAQKCITPNSQCLNHEQIDHSNLKYKKNHEHVHIHDDCCVMKDPEEGPRKLPDGARIWDVFVATSNSLKS